MSDVSNELLRDILATLKLIDTHLAAPTSKPAKKLQLGRVFATGSLPPDELDLVIADGGQRWTRKYGTDEWYPRDIEGPVLAWNELLSRAGHVTEIPPPDSEVTT